MNDEKKYLELSLADALKNEEEEEKEKMKLAYNDPFSDISSVLVFGVFIHMIAATL